MLVNIVATKFVLNQASESGGAIYIDEQLVTIDSCIFLNNKASRGGAIYYKTGKELFFKK